MFLLHSDFKVLPTAVTRLLSSFSIVGSNSVDSTPVPLDDPFFTSLFNMLPTAVVALYTPTPDITIPKMEHISSAYAAAKDETGH